MIIIKVLDLSLTPLAAFRQDEKRRYYGPSEVVQIQKFGHMAYGVGKYDRWYSFQEISKLYFVWQIPFDIKIVENDINKSISARVAYDSFGNYNVAFGIVNDMNIKKIEISLENGKILSQSNIMEGGLFLLPWEQGFDGSNYDGIMIMGYNSQNKLLFEEKLHGVSNEERYFH